MSLIKLKSNKNRVEYISQLIPQNWYSNDIAKVKSIFYRIDNLQNAFLFDSYNKNNFLIRVHQGSIECDPHNHIQYENGDYLVVLVNEENVVNVDYESRVFLGIINALSGKNTLRKYLGSLSFIFNRTENRIISFGQNDTVHNYGEIHGPLLEENNIEDIFEVHEKINQFSLKKQKKIRNSLFWFNDSFEEENLIAFIKLWIAIETLCKDKETKIIEVKKCFFIFKQSVERNRNILDSIYERLIVIYGKDLKYLKGKYKLNLFTRLRAKIYHHGKTIPLKNSFIKFCENFYIDLLRNEISLDPLYKSDIVLKSFDLNLSDYLKKATK